MEISVSSRKLPIYLRATIAPELRELSNGRSTAKTCQQLCVTWPQNSFDPACFLDAFQHLARTQAGFGCPLLQNIPNPLRIRL